jgi:hypothetical protein
MNTCKLALAATTTLTNQIGPRTTLANEIATISVTPWLSTLGTSSYSQSDPGDRHSTCQSRAGFLQAASDRTDSTRWMHPPTSL